MDELIKHLLKTAEEHNIYAEKLGSLPEKLTEQGIALGLLKAAQILHDFKK